MIDEGIGSEAEAHSLKRLALSERQAVDLALEDPASEEGEDGPV